ncbi:MAG TPA: RsmB/NOP family class I SAM-dependent RNA methyltransferase [Kofleriaceae bacterium]|nr:RsmB/NOP family class I SAM-dependent RNA methyltransferase [Kofleriaceae bacterium]
MDDAQLAAHVVDGGRLRALVLELWQRTRMDWGFVTDRLAVAFRKEKWLGAHERRFVGEILYGLVRHLRRVDFAIERGRKTKQSPRDLERLLALLVLEKLIEPARAARAVPELDWTAVATADDAIARVRDVTERIALACSLPDWLAARFVADWGSDAEALARALNERAPMTVRANLLVVADRSELALPLATHPGTWCDTAVIVDERANLFSLDAFQRGAFEAQDEGSQLLADLVVACARRDKPLVVDYCAGAGGKTLAIAARLGNRGRIVATDVDDGKLAELRRRARRAHVTNAQAMLVDDRALDTFAGKADVVFVDAPCTGTGALRRNPEARWRLRESDVAAFASRQREILARAAQLCAPDGRIVYATCSVLRAENEEVVAGQPLVALADVLGADRASALGRGPTSFTVTPHQHGTDGFFAAVVGGHR